jgi:hypothetical protein
MATELQSLRRRAHALPAEGALTLRFPNAASVQALLGAERWPRLARDARAVAGGGDRTGVAVELTPRAAELLLSDEGLRVDRVRHLVRPGMAAMWQTILNLLTFNPNFAIRAITGELRPHGARETARFAIDALITFLAAVPTALIAVAVEGGAVLARRGGVVEVTARRVS